VGEALYDSLPDGIFLGGAPTNVAVHLASLGVPTAVATCVGDDQLGREAIRRISARNVNTNYIQSHNSLNTGMVIASIDASGDATYTFDTPAAWDGLQLTETLEAALSRAKVAVIGSLACRLGDSQNAISAATISAIRNLAKENTLVMDVNLRPPWYKAEDILSLCRGKSNLCHELALFKLNDEELPIVERWCGIDNSDDLSGAPLEERLAALGKTINARSVCVTRGTNGAALWSRRIGGASVDAFVENSGYTCQPQPGSDTVGAGDAFLAALIRSLFLDQEPADKALKRACALGAFVANSRGATPDHARAPPELHDIFATKQVTVQ
jgi:fructokinase